jgi:hypothetical protein
MRLLRGGLLNFVAAIPMLVWAGISTVVVVMEGSNELGCILIGALSAAPKHVFKCASVTMGDLCG